MALKKGQERGKLSIIVPVFNEALALRSSAERLFAAPCQVEREFIFVNDGSLDESLAILTELRELHELRIVDLGRNQGKGSAVRSGIQQATGDWILVQDADLEYDPLDIPRLLKPILAGRADVVYGSRFKRSGTQVHRTFHYSVNRFLTFLSNLLSGIYLTDMETCYKVFPLDLVRNMNLISRRFGIEVELTAYLARTSARITELPIRYAPRGRLQGKKIRWTDGLAALYHLLRFNFRPTRACFHDLPERYR